MGYKIFPSDGEDQLETSNVEGRLQGLSWYLRLLNYSLQMVGVVNVGVPSLDHHNYNEAIKSVR